MLESMVLKEQKAVYKPIYVEIDHIVMEDDTPVGNLLSATPQRLFINSTDASWQPNRQCLAETKSAEKVCWVDAHGDWPPTGEKGMAMASARADKAAARANAAEARAKKLAAKLRALGIVLDN